MKIDSYGSPGWQSEFAVRIGLRSDVPQLTKGRTGQIARIGDLPRRFDDDAVDRLASGGINNTPGPGRTIERRRVGDLRQHENSEKYDRLM